jgi:hypothetical protein
LTALAASNRDNGTFGRHDRFLWPQNSW